MERFLPSFTPNKKEETMKIYSIEFYDDDNCQLFISYDFTSKTQARLVYEFIKKYNPEKTKNIRLRIRIFGPVKESNIKEAIQRAESNDKEYIGTTYDDEDDITYLTIYHIDDDNFSHTEVLKFKLPEYIAICIDKLTLTFDSTEYTTCVEIE